MDSLSGNDLSRLGDEDGGGGLLRICNALVHPNGPKQLTSLDLHGECARGFAVHAADRGVLDTGARSEDIESLCNALTHPEGPKHITKLTLSCIIHSSSYQHQLK